MLGEGMEPEQPGRRRTAMPMMARSMLEYEKRMKRSKQMQKE
jgi:hypothetical protein